MPFFGLTTPWEEVVRTLAEIPEKESIRGVAKSSGHDKSTICKWVDLAGRHCEEVTDYFLQDLHLDRIHQCLQPVIDLTLGHFNPESSEQRSCQ
jgi:hypothetical protein